MRQPIAESTQAEFHDVIRMAQESHSLKNAVMNDRKAQFVHWSLRFGFGLREPR